MNQKISKETLELFKNSECSDFRIFKVDKDLVKNVRTIDKKIKSLGFVFTYKNINHVQAIKQISEAIYYRWTILDIQIRPTEIILAARSRKKNEIAFPEKDNHFDRTKDRYQFHTFMLACAHVKEKKKAVDIGGHIGLYSLAMLDTFSEVVAFEPSPTNIECYKKNAPKAKLIECGLGDKEDSLILNIAEDNSGNSSIVEEFKGKKVLIKIKTLDSFNLENINLIKIDIQGYEVQALKGAKETIERSKPIIIAELITHKNSPPNEEAIQLLKSYNYKILDIIGKDYIWGPNV